MSNISDISLSISNVDRWIISNICLREGPTFKNGWFFGNISKGVGEGSFANKESFLSIDTTQTFCQKMGQGRDSSVLGSQGFSKWSITELPKYFLMDSFLLGQSLSFHEIVLCRTRGIAQKTTWQTQNKPIIEHFKQWYVSISNRTEKNQLYGIEAIVGCEAKRKMCVVWIHKSWSRPMKCYYPTNCPQAILTSKRGRIDSGFVDNMERECAHSQ